MKRSEMRVDPEKVREFQVRSRQPLARDPAKGLARTGGLERRSPLGANRDVEEALARERARRAPESRRARQQAAAAREALRAPTPPPSELGEFSTEAIREALRVRFQARRPARDQTCARCKRRKATGWHHWVPQEHLRVMMRGVAKANGLPASAIKRKLRSWLRDEGNLTPYCHDCHMAGEHSRREPWVRGEVPAKAWRFAEDLDDELEAAGVAREATVRLMGYPEVAGAH